jgi:hypothetical protein
MKLFFINQNAPKKYKPNYIQDAFSMMVNQENMIENSEKRKKKKIYKIKYKTNQINLMEDKTEKIFIKRTGLKIVKKANNND